MFQASGREKRGNASSWVPDGVALHVQWLLGGSAPTWSVGKGTKSQLLNKWLGGY